MRSIAVLSAALLLLGSCSADYPLKAFFKDGRLHFDGARKDWFFGRTGFCPNYFSVRDEAGATVWRIEIEKFSAFECNLFPVAYGVAPPGWETVVPVRPLKSGQVYIVNGDGGDAYHGAFRYKERRVASVENDPELARRFPNPPYEWNTQGASGVPLR